MNLRIIRQTFTDDGTCRIFVAASDYDNMAALQNATHGKVSGLKDIGTEDLDGDTKIVYSF
jgi:hypothetical protein